MKRRTVLLALACAAGTIGSMGMARAADMLRPLEPGSFRQIAAAHAGKPFVVMLWSLDCAYCLESFAALENLRRKWSVDVVTIATDRADEDETAQLIRKKLAAAGLRSQAWAFGDAPAEQLRYDIDPAWRGELPRTYWFDGKGKATAHSGLVTMERAQKALAQKARP